MLVFVIVAMAASAQRGRVVTVAVDTLQGAETVVLATIGPLTGSYQTLSISSLCTQLGGTSDGTLTIYGSNDGTNYVLINGVGGEVITASPVASITGADLNQITITNTLVTNWVIKDVAQRFYKITGVGTASDTTQVNVTYIIK